MSLARARRVASRLDRRSPIAIVFYANFSTSPLRRARLYPLPARRIFHRAYASRVLASSSADSSPRCARPIIASSSSSRPSSRTICTGNHLGNSYPCSPAPSSAVAHALAPPAAAPALASHLLLPRLCAAPATHHAHALDGWQEYFAGEYADHSSEPPSAKTLSVFKVRVRARARVRVRV